MHKYLGLITFPVLLFVALFSFILGGNAYEHSAQFRQCIRHLFPMNTFTITLSIGLLVIMIIATPALIQYVTRTKEQRSKRQTVDIIALQRALEFARWKEGLYAKFARLSTTDAKFVDIAAALESCFPERPNDSPEECINFIVLRLLAGAKEYGEGNNFDPARCALFTKCALDVAITYNEGWRELVAASNNAVLQRAVRERSQDLLQLRQDGHRAAIGTLLRHSLRPTT
jgi:hypothetical protein